MRGSDSGSALAIDNRNLQPAFRRLSVNLELVQKVAPMGEPERVQEVELVLAAKVHKDVVDNIL